MRHMAAFEEHRAQVDEDEVARLLADLPALLTEGEQARLRECARLAVEQNIKMAEIGLEAARRASTTPGEEFTRREAIARYFCMLMWQDSDAAVSENLLEM